MKLISKFISKFADLFACYSAASTNYGSTMLMKLFCIWTNKNLHIIIILKSPRTFSLSAIKIFWSQLKKATELLAMPSVIWSLWTNCFWKAFWFRNDYPKVLSFLVNLKQLIIYLRSPIKIFNLKILSTKWYFSKHWWQHLQNFLR